MSSSSITAAEEQALLNKGISKDKVDEFAAAFALFAVPVDGGHRITLESLRAMLAKFGQDYGEDDLKYMLRQFSSRAGDGSAGVDFDAFATSMHEKMADTRFNEAFGDAFDLFDSNKSGELSKVELMTGMQMLGETLTEAEADEMLKIAKKKDDFVRAMSQSLTGGGGGGSSGSGGGGAATPAAAAVTSGTATPQPAAAAAAAAGPARPAGPGGGPAGPPRPGGAPAPSGPPRPGGPPGPGPPRPAGGPPGPGGAAPRPPGAPSSPSAPRPPRPS